MFPTSVRAPKPGFAVITTLLILTNIYFFWQEIVASDSEFFISQFALIPALVNFEKLETLTPFVSAQFLHAGLVHLASNMWFLYLFGPCLEKFLGKIPFLIFYLFSGTFGFFLQFLFLADSGTPMLGASGAVAGVLGGFLVAYPKAKVNVLVPLFPLFLPILFPAQVILLYWFFSQIFNGVATVVAESAAVGGVAWWAHVGGFGVGYLLTEIWSTLLKLWRNEPFKTTRR